MKLKYTGYFLIFIGILFFVYRIRINYPYLRNVAPFSSYTMLKGSWEQYKKYYIDQDGRVRDPKGEDLTVSEGQSYALLRAVWIDDKVMFDKILNFTNYNLKRKTDNLYGWKWGKKSDGSYGFVGEGADNSATDADSDIALSLILASRRWNEAKYQGLALRIIKDIWDKETATVSGSRYLTAGNWATRENELIINPSYFAPYAWRIFAKIDTEHDWKSLIGPAYDLLQNAGRSNLSGLEGVGLPPNWLSVARQTGKIQSPPAQMNTDYSFDAARVPWRIYLDYFWNKETRAKDYLTANFTFLTDYYKKNGELPSEFSYDGRMIKKNENPVQYSTLIAAAKIIDKGLAEKIYREKIISLYSNDRNAFRMDIPYYEQNWLWFGTALYKDYLDKFE